jgi:hypothetical protein
VCSLLVFAAAATAACGPSASPQERFWSWFSEQEGRLAWATGGYGDERSNEIADRLAQIDEGLVHELDGEPGGPRTLVISADGRAALVPAARRLVAAAPALEGWTVVALRPRLGTAYTIAYRGFEVGPDEFWFREEESRDSRIALRIFVPGIGGPMHALAVEAARLVVHTAIGEEDAIEKLGRVQFRSLPSDPASRGLLPLSALPATVDSY